MELRSASGWPKPLDAGTGAFAASFWRDGRWLSLGAAHPRHGYVELSNAPDFDEAHRGDPGRVRRYRAALAEALDTAACGGPRWNLNVHSMPSNAYERLGRVATGPLADVVLGNLHGVSCSAAFTDVVAQAFRELVEE